MTGRTLVVAHRGAPRSGVPENSVRAFAEAAAAGADGVELDVRRARGGAAVVFHDRVIRLPTGRKAAVARLDAAAVRAVPLGAGQRPPSLEEAIEPLLGGRCGVIVEVKDPGVEEAVARALRAVRAESRLPWLLVASFRGDVLRAFARAEPRLRRALVLGRRTLFPVRRLDASGARDIMAHLSLVRPRLVDAVARRGGLVYAWTVNRPAEARRVAAAGVRGVITDSPQEVRTVLRKAPRT